MFKIAGEHGKYIEMLEKTEFKHWYFGHWHFDMSVDEKSTAVLNEVHKLE